MISVLRERSNQRFLITAVIVAAVLLLAFVLGRRPSVQWLVLPVAVAGGLALLARPALGLPALVLAALVVPLEVDTGTEVSLNAVTLLIPALVAIWVLAMGVRGRLQVVSRAANRPLLLFLGASLLSLLIGIATWDPFVPRSPNFTLVQLAQWAIFAFSAAAFWLTANLAAGEAWLRRMTWAFLLVGGGIAVGRQLPGVGSLLGRVTTIVFIRPPFWVLLASLAGGQILFNRSLRAPVRWGLAAVVASALVHAFVQQQEAASNWVGLGVALAVLVWLRFPRLRVPVIIVVVVLAALGFLVPSIYEFAGGDEELTASGGSRLVLIERVLQVTMRNPITGLGPAGYRPYANMEPIAYQRAYWVEPLVNSHNNYVDLFAHGGVVGMALFAWFAVEITRLGIKLRGRYRSGFAGGYVNGMLAAGAASLVIMMLADWILPFVYNIGFPGFQASVLVWLFMGGLVALDNVDSKLKMED